MASRSIVGLVFMLIISSACVANPRPEMALVPGGDFVMGMQDGEDNPIHAVRVNSYMLGKYEVTVGEWREFTEDADVPFPWNQFEFLSLVRRNVGFVLPDDWPIYYLTWYEAVWYCNWLSVRKGLQPAYELDLQTLRRYLYEREDPAPQVIWNKTANGYRLPTEAEWEYAAVRGRDGTNSDALDLGYTAWTRVNSGGKPHSVGSKRSNSLGIYDLLGNVAEWCWDFYDPSYYLRSERENPGGPERGRDPSNFEEGIVDIHSFRGCSWRNTETYCTPQFRFRSRAVLHGAVGVRLARNAP